MAEEPPWGSYAINRQYSLCVCMFSRVFENQPNEICSHLSEKASKGRFFGPDKLQNHSNEEKRKEKKKNCEEHIERRRKERSNGCTLSFYNGYFGQFWTKKKCWTEKIHKFGGNVFNPARCMYVIWHFHLPKNIRACLAKPSSYIQLKDIL